MAAAKGVYSALEIEADVREEVVNRLQDLGVEIDAEERPYEAWARYLSTKLEALGWVAGGTFAVAYGDGKTNLVDLCRHDDRVARGWVYAAAGSAAVNVLIFLYLAVWVSWWKRAEWHLHAPHAVPLGTLCGLVTLFAFTVGTWPALGFLAPIYTGVLFMAFLMHFHFPPPLTFKKD